MEVKYTGPLAPGKETKEVESKASFHNITFNGTVSLKEIEIIYYGDEVVVLDEDMSTYAVTQWRD